MWTTPSLSDPMEEYNWVPFGAPEWSVSKDSIDSGNGREQPAAISRCTSLQTRGHPNHLCVSQEDQDRSIPPLSIPPPHTSQNQCGLLASRRRSERVSRGKSLSKEMQQFSDMFQAKGYPQCYSRCWFFPTLKKHRCPALMEDIGQ